MFKVNYISMPTSSVIFTKVFKTEDDANVFIKHIDNRFISLKII